MPANGNGVRPAAHEEQPGAAAPQAVAGQQPPAVPGPQMELAPFALTPQQQQLVDQILAKWEKESERVGTFVCDFTRWEIDPVFGPKENEYLITEANGTIKYKSPDRGEYDVAKLTRWDKQKAGYVSDEIGCERWMCDGKAIYEWDRKNKLLKVRMLPDDLKGKSIADGPLPFVFGAKAEQLKRRYWLRDITPQQLIGKQIWLDARPKFQQDAANFQRATVVLNEKTFLPEALQLFPPGIAPAPGKPEAYTAFGFRPPSVNNPLDQLQFLPPITLPLLWKRVVVEDPSKQPDNPLPPAGEPAQAQRPAAPASRK
ncbi:MAG: TIGR03009 domain-containing protein [Pirellulales bacterium]